MQGGHSTATSAGLAAVVSADEAPSFVCDNDHPPVLHSRRRIVVAAVASAYRGGIRQVLEFLFDMRFDAARNHLIWGFVGLSRMPMRAMFVQLI